MAGAELRGSDTEFRRIPASSAAGAERRHKLMSAARGAACDCARGAMPRPLRSSERRRSRGLFSRFRQEDMSNRALVRLTLEPDPATVSFHNP